MNDHQKPNRHYESGFNKNKNDDSQQNRQMFNKDPKDNRDFKQVRFQDQEECSPPKKDAGNYKKYNTWNKDESKSHH